MKPAHIISLLSLFSLLGASLMGRDEIKIGTGDPGMRIVWHGPRDSVIYLDEPFTVVAGGIAGGSEKRNIRVIIDQGYGFTKNHLEVATQQLYPFDVFSAFTCEGGSWSGPPLHDTWVYSAGRKTQGFYLRDGKLTAFDEVQERARSNYGLKPNNIFLGCLDGKVFYWEAYVPDFLYWKEQTTGAEYLTRLPHGRVAGCGVCAAAPFAPAAPATKKAVVEVLMKAEEPNQSPQPIQSTGG